MNSDPFDVLSQAGSNATTLIPLLAPLGLGALSAIIVYFFIRVRRRRLESELFKSPVLDTKISATEEAAQPPTEKVKEPSDPDSDVKELQSATQESLLQKFWIGLQRTRTQISDSLKTIITGKAVIDDELTEKIHEVLFKADIGVKTSDRLVQQLRKDLVGQPLDWSAIQGNLITQMTGLFAASSSQEASPAEGPRVILIIGVNGVGKTTTVGKLAARFKADGRSVLLCAADTFRAAAIDQLQVWGDRNKIDVIKHGPGADPSAVAFDGVKAAKARGSDVLLIDTAGRLHSKVDLMAELGKIKKAISKEIPNAPHETWIVLDATTGQNAVQQCKAFSEVTPITGIIVTKLDGTAKGGVIVGIADQFKIPVRYIGIGEKAADLRPFIPKDFVTGIIG